MGTVAFDSFRELSFSEIAIVSGGDITGVLEGVGGVVVGVGTAALSAASIPATGGLDALPAYLGIAGGVTIATAGVIQIENSL
ncbi:MAG TPA: hypothetical protein VG434_00280 [Sphingomicrobium sp.]|nr:hypothetical protein [Sphingomicrobium sp.]